MVYSVSDAVRDALLEMSFLRPAIEKDLLNYSAVARFIQPIVVQKLGMTPSIDAIVVAVRRNVELYSNKKDKGTVAALKTTKVTLRTDLCMVLIDDWRQSDVIEHLRRIFSGVDFNAGEKFYIMTRSSECMVVCNSKFLSEVEKISPTRIRAVEKDLAVITINIRGASHDVPGILDFFTDQFDRVNVNIFEVFSSRGKISFLITQKHAARAYEGITTGLESVKSTA